jgi:hypothetical protein
VRRILHTARSGSTGRIVATHGMYGTRTYRSWQAMISRCTRPSDPFFSHYGGRGITICDHWLYSFENFYRDMGARPDGKTLGRIDNDANYCLDNCRWETPSEQASNRSSVIWIEHCGVRLHLEDWSRRTGIGPSRIRRRLQSGWSVERALTTPTSAYNTAARREARIRGGFR